MRLAGVLLASLLVQATPAVPWAPYVATPPDVVDRMLTLAKVDSSDVVYDLGCGDGRIVIAAAQKFGARGVGVDIDPVRIAEANANAKRAGVEKLVTFTLADVLETDVSDATVVTLYMLSAINVKLRPILTKELAKGSRIVSHNFAMGDWEPDHVDTFKDGAGTTRTLYLWTIPLLGCSVAGSLGTRTQPPPSYPATELPSYALATARSTISSTSCGYVRPALRAAIANSARELSQGLGLTSITWTVPSACSRMSTRP